MNHSLVGRILETQFPELRPVYAEYLGEGYDSTVFEVNGNWVFRFPKREDVEQQLLLERRILPVLAETSPIPVPAFRFFGQPSGEFPRSFAGYPRIPGTPGIQIEPSGMDLAGQLGSFLSWLHSFPVSDAARCGVAYQETDLVFQEIRSGALVDFDTVRKIAPEAPLDQWHAYLEAGIEMSAGTRATPVLIHNDLAAEHVLIDVSSGTATGVIDWSDIIIGDPAIDFAGMFHWGGDTFVQEILSGYTPPITSDVLRRAKFMGACRGAGDVVFGLEMQRPEYIEAGLRALRLLLVA